MKHIHSIAHDATKQMYVMRDAIGHESFDKIIERARELIKLDDIINESNKKHSNNS